MKHTIGREYHFSSAHIIPDHPKCGRMHGHNYKLEVTISGPIKEDGMIMDYSDMDKIIKPVVKMLDHQFIVGLGHKDHPLVKAVASASPSSIRGLSCHSTTAEDLCGWLWDNLVSHFGSYGCVLEEIVLCETVKSKATLRRN